MTCSSVWESLSNGLWSGKIRLIKAFFNIHFMFRLKEQGGSFVQHLQRVKKVFEIIAAGYRSIPNTSFLSLNKYGEKNKKPLHFGDHIRWSGKMYHMVRNNENIKQTNNQTPKQHPQTNSNIRALLFFVDLVILNKIKWLQVVWNEITGLTWPISSSSQ